MNPKDQHGMNSTNLHYYGKKISWALYTIFEWKIIWSRPSPFSLAAMSLIITLSCCLFFRRWIDVWRQMHHIRSSFFGFDCSICTWVLIGVWNTSDWHREICHFLSTRRSRSLRFVCQRDTHIPHFQLMAGETITLCRALRRTRGPALLVHEKWML